MARYTTLRAYLNGCAKKVGYRDEAKAEKRAAQYGMRYYECSVCGKYHCTSQALDNPEDQGV